MTFVFFGLSISPQHQADCKNMTHNVRCSSLDVILVKKSVAISNFYKDCANILH